MANSEREELDRMLVLSKLGMPAYGEITTSKRSYKVVAIGGVPVELSVFSAIIMRHCAHQGTTSPSLEVSTEAFWQDIGYEAPKPQKMVDGWNIPTSRLSVGGVLLDALQGRDFTTAYRTKYDSDFDFLPVLKHVNELMLQYTK